MNQSERDKILTASHNLELREVTPDPWFDPYSDMTTEEKSKLIIELMSSQKSDRERIDSLMNKLDRMTESQLAANEASTLLRVQLSELMHLLQDKEAAYRLLQSEKEALAEELKVNRKTLYGSKSQKGIYRKRIINHPKRKKRIILTAARTLSHRLMNTPGKLSSITIPFIACQGDPSVSSRC